MNLPDSRRLAERLVYDVVHETLAGRRKATKYYAPGLVIKATARHKPKRRARSVEIVVTIGAPNYAERQFVKQLKKAGEPFPVKRVQVKEWK